VTERRAVGSLTATDGPLAGSSATGSLQPRKKRQSGGLVAFPGDMSAIGRLLSGGLSGGVQHCSGVSGGGGASGTSNLTSNLTAGGKQKVAPANDR
jgi:hypothetical protein